MGKYVMIEEEVYEKAVAIAKKNHGPVRQAVMQMIDFAYDNMNNPVINLANAITPQKGMTPEEVKQTPKYKELEEQLAALKQEAWEIEGMEINSAEDMNEVARRSKENKDKQAEIQNQMRAMLNV